MIASYGQHRLDDAHIYRSQAKRGTHSFFAYATASLILHGQRFTLAVIPVTRAESLKQVLQEVLAVVSKAGLKIGLLLLDRGFYSVEVIRYLQRARRPILMPVVGHGRKGEPTQKVQPSPLLGRMQGEVIRSGRLVDVLPFWFQVGQGRSACWAGS